jgi:alcohol dehydrogenase (cytochrome c)
MAGGMMNMWNVSRAAAALIIGALGTGLGTAQVKNFVPVTGTMLENPSPNDWLMFSRTYDAQRYSPLAVINKTNVSKLKMAWTRGFGAGPTGTVPLVYNGTMYIVTPGAAVQALDATTGDMLWEYQRKVPANVAAQARSKSLAIFGDVIAFTAPDSFVVGLDAKTGEMRWESKTDSRGHTSGPIIADGKVISGGACAGNRANCYIAAHDALTGKEAWRFYTTPAPGEPGDESWAGAPLERRLASTWGMPGAYDAAKKTLIWGIANPMPDQRMTRHGKPDGVSLTAPSDLYSNSTVALNVETGKLAWYYQHLPGDDSDLDFTNERILARSKIAPNPKFVKWINPAIKPGEVRNVTVTIGEGGGFWVNDRDNGEFLYATPFPFDTPEFAIADIDVKTGKTKLNWDNVVKGPAEKHTICYWNTKSYWPMAYSPQTNSIYTSYIDNCRELISAGPNSREQWRVVQRPGAKPNELTGMAKINVETGEVTRYDVGRAPGNGAVLATAGGLIFHGDMSRRFKAFDSVTNKVLWETILGGNVSVSTITYAVNGKQYIAVMTGDNLKVPELAGEVPELRVPKGGNAVYVFALP